MGKDKGFGHPRTSAAIGGCDMAISPRGMNSFAAHHVGGQQRLGHLRRHLDLGGRANRGSRRHPREGRSAHRTPANAGALEITCRDHARELSGQGSGGQQEPVANTGEGERRRCPWSVLGRSGLGLYRRSGSCPSSWIVSYGRAHRGRGLYGRPFRHSGAGRTMRCNHCCSSRTILWNGNSESMQRNQSPESTILSTV